MNTAEEIMNFTEPGELFTDNIAAMKEEYSRLAKIWHPDHNGSSDESNEVMSRINTLYKKGVEMIRNGKWKKPGFVKLRSRDGKLHQISYLTEADFELGTSYICDRVVVFIVRQEFKALFHNAIERMSSFRYANDRMRIEISKGLPRIISEFKTLDHSLAVVIEKEPDMLLLRDVLRYYDGKLPDRHIAWILGSLYNLACYMDYSGLTHNSISTDTCYISPNDHNVKILGGWWYSVPSGSKMPGVPEKIYAVLPPKVMNSKVADIRTDLESIRLVGRELTGDRTGSSLESSGIPVPFIEWLKGAAAGSAFEEYSNWNDILTESYGIRRFVPMELNAGQLYINKN